ncbi:M1 family metallopeptidase [Riemerella columbina]|uniref:M1 family metallopeptidase n=1 Tax=Riemerella columbina TaxID=103810 RepID=UPI00266EA714|nr:M1 family metallopeptidase [Riemerella columbina]WKS96000.1 M1 family metallopeptidase [Riemerella columbina]
MKKLLISALALGVLLTSQQALAQTETSGRVPLYRAAHTKTTELKHTKLRVSFDFDKEQMNGEEWLTANPYFYPTDSLVLNAKAMLIHEVAMDIQGKRAPLKYTYQDDLLNINLGKTYQKNQDYTVYIKYTARPNEVKAKGSAAITDAKGLYFINAQGKDPDKPTQIWTQGETESNSVWFPTIDKPNQKTTQEIEMTVPDRFVTLSNGVLKNSTKQGNLRTDHWVMEQKHAPYLFFMGVGDYAVIKDHWRNIPVDYYVEKDYADVAQQIFGNTPEMMEFFSKKVGVDYPWVKYSQLVGRDYVSGAMENTTAVIHGEGAQQKAGDLIDENRWESTIAHELFHHWFGDLVTAESWSNLTVNESFANYSEYLWEEYKYGKDAADYHMANNRGHYIHSSFDFNKDLVRFDYASREDMFDLVSYNKGGSILHMLRNYLGDDAFFAGIQDYLKTNAYGTGEAHQLRLSFEKVSGKDLNWFFNQWYFDNGNPQLNISYSYEPVKKQVTVSIAQTQSKYFQFPLAIDLHEGKNVTRKTVWVDAKAKNNFSFNVGKNPDLINIDPDGVLLAQVTDSKTPEQYYLQYTKAGAAYKSRALAVEDAEKHKDNVTAQKLLLAALKDPFFRIRIQALNALDLANAAEAKLYASEVERLAQNDDKTLVKAAAIIALSKTKNKKYLPIYEKSINSPSNAVKASTLAAIAQTDPERIKTLADQVDLSGASEDLVMELLPVIVKNKVEKQRPYIGSIVAFYPFLKFQNPELGTVAEEGFNWIMTSDDAKATERIAKVLTQAKSQMPDNPQVKMMIVQMLKDGIAKKMEALKKNPNSASLNGQVERLNQVLELYNK